jgi:16S rRNA processing protein RimM
VADGPGWRIRFHEITTRDAADALRGAYLESVVRPNEDLDRGSYYWHEVIGCTVRGVDGVELGTVRDIYRIGETEVFTVDGGPFGSFDLPAVRAFIRIFAPRRGEIVVDAESLDLRAPRSRQPDPDRPKAPRRRTRRKSAPPPAPPT